MTRKNLLYIPALCCSLLFASSCYNEIDLDKYRGEEGENILTLNSLVCPDSTVAVSATRTYFFSDIHNERTYVKGLDVKLSINGEEKETLSYDNSRNLYISQLKPNEGDKIGISTMFDNKQVEAAAIIPFKSDLNYISVERRGPIAMYSDYDFVFTYRLSFQDNPSEDNYYFLQWDDIQSGKDISIGLKDFTHELVFQKLADQIRPTLPGWTPYSPYGLPFTDRGIEGKNHTLVLEEIIQAGNGGEPWRLPRMRRVFKLYSISKPYYDYLVSSLINDTDDKGIQGGMIDLGIADPVKVYSNITNGVGILGCYSSSETEIDVIKEIGPIPEK